MKNIKIKLMFDTMKFKVFGVCLFILFIFGFIFISNTWKYSMKETEENAKQLAEVAEAGSLTHTSQILSGDIDENDIEYKCLKNSLSQFVELANDIRFAYIYTKKEDRLYFIADSEPIDSEYYSSLGQLYSEAAPVYYLPYETRTTVLTEPVNDRWGRWISVLVPIKTLETNEIIAIFGVDYPADSWHQFSITNTVKSSLIVMSIIIIFIVLFFLYVKNCKLKDIGIKLKESEMLFKSVFNQANIGIAIVHNFRFTLSSENSRLNINPMFEKIMRRTKEELATIDWPDITHPDDLAEDMDCFRKFKSGEIDGYNIEKRFILPDGSIKWIRMIISKLTLENSKEDNHLCLIEDISKRKELEKVIYESERSKAILLDNLPGMMYRCYYDKEWTMQYVSNGCLELTGYRPESLLYNKELSFNELITPKYQEYIWQKWGQKIKERGKLKEEYEIITAAGEIKWVWEQGQGIYDDDGNVLALEGFIIDITRRKMNEIKLKYLTEHDSLTGIKNLRSFEERCIKNNAVSKTRSAVLLVNIRRFSIINSALGYRFGEKLIIFVAVCLSQLASDRNLLFHISVDRFIFYITEYEGKQDLINLCKKIIEALNSEIRQKSISFNIGILEIDSSSGDVESIIKNVSASADQVNNHDRFGYCFFDKKMEDKFNRDIIISQALADTLNNQDDTSLFIQYQPILNLKTNEIVGFEALARYKHEDLGIISPAEFIHVSESSQMMLPLGKKIIRLVFNFTTQLSQMGYKCITMAFNISAIQLLSEIFYPEFEVLLQETGVDPHNLVIEITESVFFDNFQDINIKLDKLKTLGIKIAIDDFGTGYSSLARVRECNVDILKIDKHFIDKLLVINTEDAITSDIISMAHKLGHSVIAEGVEHEKQKQYLLDHNCDMMQGYLYSKPLDEVAVINLLSNYQSTLPPIDFKI